MCCRQSVLALLVALFVPVAALAADPVPAIDAGGPSGAGPLPLPPRDADARRAWLKARIDEILGAAAFSRARVSVAVMDPESGRLVYSKNEKAGLNAASNVKIVTEAAALALLGPEFRWKTSVLAASPAEGGKLIVAGEVRGDLYVKTSGDPTLSTYDLNGLAASLTAIGLRRVRGALVVDTSVFDGSTMPPAFEQKNDSAAFRAPSSAASLNGNVVAVTITPAASAGAPARIVVDPASSAVIVSGGVTTAAKGPAVPEVDTSDAGSAQTRITVGGRIL